MSGLKQKAKTLRDKSFIIGSISTNPRVVFLADAQEEIKAKDEEIAKLTKQLEKLAWYCEDCEEWHAKGMICAVHEVRKVRNGRGRNDY